MTEKDYINFKYSTRYFLFEKGVHENEISFRVHQHHPCNEEYLGAYHRKCNSNFKQNILVFLRNLKFYVILCAERTR